VREEYHIWPDALPHSLEASRLADQPQTIVELDLEELRAIDLPHGYGRDWPENRFWQPKPPRTELISAATTTLTVRCELDTDLYPSRVVVSDAAINLKRAEFVGEWNYTISPNDHPQIAR
jgi:hypothetical protein